MQTLELRDLKRGLLNIQPYTFTHFGDGQLEPIAYYNRMDGEIICDAGPFSSRTYSVCPSDRCYVFNSDSEKDEFEKKMKERLRLSRIPRGISVDC